MALACGCELRGGMPVNKELTQAHLKHTMEALFFWELLRRQKDFSSSSGDDTASEARLKLSQARIAVIEAIEELYPEAKSE